MQEELTGLGSGPYSIPLQLPSTPFFLSPLCDSQPVKDFIKTDKNTSYQKALTSIIFRPFS